MRTTTQRGSVFLEVAHLSSGVTWYLLRTCQGTRCRVLLELEIYPDGLCLDLIRLDQFWGRVPRPL